MDEGVYGLPGSLNHRGGRHAQQEQYSLRQPQFKQPFQSLQPRDRYRASRLEPQYDRVEDDEYANGDPLDSFGKLHDESAYIGLLISI